jgi:hypothetical protein
MYSVRNNYVPNNSQSSGKSSSTPQSVAHITSCNLVQRSIFSSGSFSYFITYYSSRNDFNAMELLAHTLKPIPAVVWGGPALEFCGVKAFFRVGAMISFWPECAMFLQAFNMESLGLYVHRK